MSKLRPECGSGENSYCPPTQALALEAVYYAVLQKSQLIAGRLHHRGESCALGSYWDVHPAWAFPGALTDTVAAVNDLIPGEDPIKRRARVLRWLKRDLGNAGVVGFRRYRTPAVTVKK